MKCENTNGQKQIDSIDMNGWDITDIDTYGLWCESMGYIPIKTIQCENHIVDVMQHPITHDTFRINWAGK